MSVKMCLFQFSSR